MSVPTVTVTVKVFGPDGVAISGAVVTALLSAFDLYQNQTIYPIEQSATTNGSGVATLALFPNALGERNTFYTFKAKDSAGKVYWQTTAVVPNANSNLDEISPSHPPLAEDTGVSDFVNLPFLDQTSRYESYLKNWNTASRTYTFPDHSGNVLVSTIVIGAAAGLLAIATSGDIAARTLQAPAAGITITNPSGSAGDPTFALANDLAAVEGLALTGMAARTALDTWATRTITGTANQVNVSNGDGVLGNPTLSLPQNIHTGAAPEFGGLTLTGALSASPANANVTLSPTGTGTVTINPATAGAMNNMVIGAVTPLAGTFTALTATGSAGIGGAAIAGVRLAITGQAGITDTPGLTIVDTASRSYSIYNDGTLHFYDATSAADRLTISSAGAVSMPGNVTLGDAVGDVHTWTGLLTGTGTANTKVLTIAGAGSGDIFYIKPQAAGIGAQLFARNAADSAYEPMDILAEYVATWANAAEITRVTSTGLGIFCTPTGGERLRVEGFNAAVAVTFRADTTTTQVGNVWNTATTGDNLFLYFLTEGGAGTLRGSIDYNRAGGAVRYNTTSDYRAKILYGRFDYLDARALLAALTVHKGQMVGATQIRPMFVAHEAQEIVPYAVSGTKDEIGPDYKPRLQQMDHQILVPLLTVGWQDHEQRIAALESRVLQ